MEILFQKKKGRKGEKGRNRGHTYGSKLPIA